MMIIKKIKTFRWAREKIREKENIICFFFVDNVTTVTSTLLCFSLGVLLRSSFDLDTNVPYLVHPKVLFMDQT